MSEVKQALYKLCVNYVQSRSEAAEQAIQSAQQSAADDTKSSAGDKYETGREMAQQETNRNMAQLTEANKLKIALNLINPNALPSVTAQSGSLVITNNGKFYIGISAGLLTYNNESYFAVSLASPIGIQLKGKSKGETFNLNNKAYTIQIIL